MNINAMSEMSNLLSFDSDTVINDCLLSCVQPLLFPGGMIITPSRAGYVMITTDCVGLKNKFTIEGLPEKRASSGILVSSLEQLAEIAVVNDKVLELYQEVRAGDVLFGCLLPLKKDLIEQYLVDSDSIDFITDENAVSCFVIKHGFYTEQISELLWSNYKVLSFASSVNSGDMRNISSLHQIDKKILDDVDLVIDDCCGYVPMHTVVNINGDRCEPGTIISMVNDNGQLFDRPTVIREGQDVDKIKQYLSGLYGSFD